MRRFLLTIASTVVHALHAQAVRQQKREVARKQNGAANGHGGDGEEDVQMRQSRAPRTRKRRRGQGDVEMVDAEARSPVTSCHR
jgi:hypothetical protein